MTKRIGVVFPGYGDQYIGMGKDLYDQSRMAQEFFESAAGTTNVNFVKLCFASSHEEISSVRYAYLAIYLFECCLYAELFDRGFRPDFIAGYGVGEYAACFASKSLSFVDGMYFLNKYSQFYDDYLKTSVGKKLGVLHITRDFTLKSLQELCDSLQTEQEPLFISAQNSEHGFMVAGNVSLLKKIQKYCKTNVIRKVKLVGSAYGLYSPFMDQIVESLKLYYHKIQFKPLEVPVITNVDGVYVTSHEALQSAIMRKINHRIEWYEVIKGLQGCDIIVSVGPGSKLIDFCKEIYPDKEYRTVESLKDVDALKDLFETGQNVEGFEPNKDLVEADVVNELPSDFDVDDED